MNNDFKVAGRKEDFCYNIIFLLKIHGGSYSHVERVA